MSRVFVVADIAVDGASADPQDVAGYRNSRTPQYIERRRRRLGGAASRDGWHAACASSQRQRHRRPRQELSINEQCIGEPIERPQR